MATSSELGIALREWLDICVERQGGQNTALRPEHYHPFHWPVHPITHDYAIPRQAWNTTTSWNFHGKQFEVLVASTGQGVFGRCEALIAEARGEDLPNMLKQLEKACEPLFNRKREVSKQLDLPELFDGKLIDLDILSLFKLFFSRDRALAHDAANRLETGISHALLGHAMIEILRERHHQNRAVAHWLVLDMLELHESYVTDDVTDVDFAHAIRDLMWNADNDFARSIFKAGVVLGGHMCTEASARTILELMSAPSKIARRSSMHASLHLCEWMPEQKPNVLARLAEAERSDEEPLLRVYAKGLYGDIERDETEHVEEPTFPDEL